MKIKVHIIAPYESMLYIIKECIPLFPELDIAYSVGDLAKGAEIALSEEKKGTDIIISRGGTAKLIKKAVSIPVIDMQLSGYDMIRSLSLASHFEDKTAIVGFPSITSGAQAIIDLLELPLEVFTINSSDEVAPLLLELKNLNFKQIAGDVITLETANAYGLKGFLIQSGKETIIRSLEDAKLIYGYLYNSNKINYILEQFTLQQNRNLLIYDANNELIYEHLTDFFSSPITEEQLSLLHADLDLQQNKITRNFVWNDWLIDIAGYYQSINGQLYKIYMLQKNKYNILKQDGITLHADTLNEPIAAISAPIRFLLDRIKVLYERNEPILLQGDPGTGKDFITSYIHQTYTKDGMLITIDCQQCQLDNIDKDALTNVRTIKIKNIDPIQDHKKVAQLVQACLKQNIHLFIITTDSSASLFFQKLRINKLIMPSLAEREEDIQPLVQYFLADFHQRLGTAPVKISNDALQLLKDYTRNANIDDLKQIVKQIALIEKDFVIHSDTIQSVVTDSTKDIAGTISLNGTLREIEKEIIKHVLMEENNNQSKAAERLGINRATLWRKLKE